MFNITEYRAPLNQESINRLINVSDTEEHLTFSLRSPKTKKAVIFSCAETDSILKIKNYQIEFRAAGYSCAVFIMPIKEIGRVVLSLSKLDPEVILDFFFELHQQKLARKKTRRFQN